MNRHQVPCSVNLGGKCQSVAEIPLLGGKPLILVAGVKSQCARQIHWLEAVIDLSIVGQLQSCWLDELICVHFPL